MNLKEELFSILQKLKIKKPKNPTELSQMQWDKNMNKSTKPKWSSKPKPKITVDKNELKNRLTPIQYRVTQEKATERPFSGEYLRLKDNGMYCCLVCGEELFSSQCKYESGCGWPAFFDIIDPNKVQLTPDLSHVGGNLLLLAIKPDMVRTEVSCSKCGSHLGHIFDDGPKPTGKRYCINSASLTFHQSKKPENQNTSKSNNNNNNSNNNNSNNNNNNALKTLRLTN